MDINSKDKSSNCKDPYTTFEYFKNDSGQIKAKTSWERASFE